MNRRAIILVFVLLALIAAYLLFLRRTPPAIDGARATAESTSSTSSASRVEREVEHVPEGSSDDPSNADSDAPAEDEGENTSERRLPRQHLTGIVLEDGQPVAGAIVWAHSRDEPQRFETRSGPDGRFGLDVVERYAIRVHAEKGGNRRGSVRAYLPPGAPLPKELRIVLHRAGVVVVTVRNARDHQPVRGARVRCSLADRARETVRAEPEGDYGPIETDAQGRATLLITLAGKYSLEAEHDELGVALATETLEVSEERRSIALELRGSSAVVGHVYDDQHAPISGAKLVLSPEKPSHFGHRGAVSGGDGAFRIGGVDAGAFTLRVQAKLYPTVEMRLDKKDDANDVYVEVTMKAGRSIEGRVVDPRDAPLEGWAVYAFREKDERRGETADARSGRDGSFVVRGLEDGAYLLLLGRPGLDYPDYREGSRPTRAYAGDKGVVLRAPEVAELDGEVHFEGPPPAEYEVSIDQQQIQVRPGSAHTFHFEGLAPENVTATVRAAGYGSSSQSVDLSAGAAAHVSFTLRPELRASGRVIDRETGAPIAGARVIVEEGYGVEPATTESDGTFVLTALEEGSLTLLVKADDYAGTRAGPFSVSADAQLIVVRLARGVIVSGRVHAGERPLNARVWIMDREHGWAARSAGSTDEQGRFSLTGVSPGAQLLSVGDRDGQRAKSIPLDVPASGLSNIDVDFSGGARVVLTLPPSDRYCYLTVTRGVEDREHQSRMVPPGTSEVVVDGLEPGTFHLELMCSMLVLSEEDTRRVDFTIEAGQTEVRVTVPPP